MSYALEELRVGIVELFDDAAGRARYPAAFGELRMITGAPPLQAHNPGINSIESWRKQIATLLRRGYCVCSRCGARAEIHRCPAPKERT